VDPRPRIGAGISSQGGRVDISGGGIGGVLGGLSAERAADRLGIGRAISAGSIMLAVAHFAAPLAFGGPGITVPLLFGAAALANFVLVVSSVNQTSLIQQLVPSYMLGRVSATQAPRSARIGRLTSEF
jgi:predicted MFS family arabinose efflux permease